MGSGTSLAGFDWSRLPQERTIALNDAIVPLPLARFHLFSDHVLVRRYFARKYPKSTTVVCQLQSALDLLDCAACSFKEQLAVFRLAPTAKAVLERDDFLYMGHTVGTAGIQLAWKVGATRIILLGIDAYRLEGVNYHDGRLPSKLHSEVSREDNRILDVQHQRWIVEMREVAEAFRSRGLYQEPWSTCGVFNASPLSNIDAWPKVDPSLAFPASLSSPEWSTLCRSPGD